MAKHGKRYKAAVAEIEKEREYLAEEAITLSKNSATAKFDETIDVCINLGVDPRHADQIVRGTVSMPNGTGKNVSILVLAKGDLVDKAKEAGADFAGSDEFLEKIKLY